ncbi:unnamed protein product [Darwinula stevensoni]|uniref:Dehydrogenase/reductase SDR family member 7 n=1 Tax=Darwinula stevensoni TaxID=69355 RepID=A0A7R9A5K0_9CRUS|nr:unnamed protein product [Darwinula stevensoni]CAG0892240.1 unnamed protein product [Darwinula stevensoni]
MRVQSESIMFLWIALFLFGIVLLQLIFLKIDCDPSLYFYKYFGKSPEALRGKVVWITGAGSGIGRELAVSLAKVGAKLVLHSLKASNLDSVKELCLQNAKGSLKDEDILLIYGDVANCEMHEKWVESVLHHFEKVDILINNAGVSSLQTVFESTRDAIKRLFDVNFLGNIMLAKALLPHFRQRKAGHIVASSSVLAIFSTPKSSAYSASKRAIQGYYETLRVEEARNGTKITLLFPGLVKIKPSTRGISEDRAPIDRSYLNAFEMDVEVCADWVLIAIANEMSAPCIAKKWMLFTLIYHFPSIARWFMVATGGPYMKALTKKE